MKGKKPWLSKTLWVNALAIIGLFVQWIFGWNLDADTQLAILAFVNVVLRQLTQEPLSWSGAETTGEKDIGQ